MNKTIKLLEVYSEAVPSNEVLQACELPLTCFGVRCSKCCFYADPDVSENHYTVSPVLKVLVNDYKDTECN